MGRSLLQQLLPAQTSPTTPPNPTLLHIQPPQEKEKKHCLTWPHCVCGKGRKSLPGTDRQTVAWEELHMETGRESSHYHYLLPPLPCAWRRLLHRPPTIPPSPYSQEACHAWGDTCHLLPSLITGRACACLPAIQGGQTWAWEGGCLGSACAYPPPLRPGTLFIFLHSLAPFSIPAHFFCPAHAFTSLPSSDMLLLPTGVPAHGASTTRMHFYGGGWTDGGRHVSILQFIPSNACDTTEKDMTFISMPLLPPLVPSSHFACEGWRDRMVDWCAPRPGVGATPNFSATISTPTYHLLPIPPTCCLCLLLSCHPLPPWGGT